MSPLRPCGYPRPVASPLRALKALLAQRREARRQRARRADPIGTFIAERTRYLQGSFVPAARMYSEYERWSQANGLYAHLPQAVSRRLASFGYRKQAGRGGVHWLDIDLLVEDVR